MGKGGGLIEILYAAAGFLHVRRKVYETIRQRHQHLFIVPLLICSTGRTGPTDDCRASDAPILDRPDRGVNRPAMGGPNVPKRPAGRASLGKQAAGR